MELTNEDAPRLNNQCQRILDRLRAGPATNDDLSALSLKYTGRISDLRKAGHVIRCTRIGGGLTRYELTQHNHGERQ